MRGKTLQLFEREISTPEHFEHKVIHLFISQLYGIRCSGLKGNFFGKHIINHFWKTILLYNDDNCH